MGRIVKITNAKELYDRVEAIMRTLKRRGVSYAVTAHSNDLATIRISVTGISGTSSKTVLIKYDTVWEWQAYYGDNKNYLTNFGELNNVMRTIIAELFIINRKI